MSEPGRAGRRAKKVVISVFIVLNLTAIAYANRPSWAENGVDGVLRSSVSPQTVYRVRYLGWLTARYGHLAGLDNRWQMFGAQPRFNWWLHYRAYTADGRTVDLPLPMQSERGFIDRTFFDFREAKYYLNLYSSEDLQRRFARYLCRAFPEVEGAPTVSVELLRKHQVLLDPENAEARGTHLDPQVHSQPLFQEACASGGKR